jgi:hypothetical protein
MPWVPLGPPLRAYPDGEFSWRELEPLKKTPAGAFIGRMDAAQIRRLLTALNDD